MVRITKPIITGQIWLFCSCEACRHASRSVHAGVFALEQLDTILVFLLNHATNFPRLWKITYEISCLEALRRVRKNIVRAGTDYIGSILNKFTRLQAQLENKRVVHTTLPEHKAVQEQITILKYVVSSVYNISVTCRDAFDLIIDTAPNTF